MKSKILHTAYLFCCLMALSACIKPDSSDSRLYKSPGYMFLYTNISSIGTAPTYIVNQRATALLCVYGGYYTGAEAYLLSNDQRYYDLCVKYGDLKPGGQNCHVDSSGFSGTGSVSFAEAIDEIHITSSEEWDAQHAAGVPLDDIFEVEYDSYMPYIRNNYEGEPRTHFCKTLTDIQPGDMYLSTDITFNTQSRPAAAQQHTLTVVFVLDTGETREYDVEIDFSVANVL